MRLFDVTSSQHVLNDFDTIGNVNDFFEKSKCIPSIVPLQLISGKFAEAMNVVYSLRPPL